jgi:uncharacterized protein YodC (DUF2158 family)
MTTQRPFHIGEVVYLKSGSPPLTVTAMGSQRSFSQDGQEAWSIVDVEWFVGELVRRDSFLAECLTTKSPFQLSSPPDTRQRAEDDA